MRREIAHYNSLAVKFAGFTDARGLADGEIELVCVDKRPADLIRSYAPSYSFEIRVGGAKAGAVSFRVGYTKNLYYSGQIGYAVDSAYRGNGYAGKACVLLIPLIKKHGMSKLLITTNPENKASRRVCEKLGARLIRVAKIPRSHELYDIGDRYKCIYEWDINNYSG